MNRGTILLVEDNEDDVFLMKRALKSARINNPLQLVEDGRMAIDYLAGTGKFSDRHAYPLPSVIFLDLKLPHRNGFEVLTWLRTQPEFRDLTVIILTSSSEPADVERAKNLGSQFYMVKPPRGPELLALAKTFGWTWLEFAE